MDPSIRSSVERGRSDSNASREPPYARVACGLTHPVASAGVCPRLLPLRTTYSHTGFNLGSTV